MGVCIPGEVAVVGEAAPAYHNASLLQGVQVGAGSRLNVGHTAWDHHKVDGNVLCLVIGYRQEHIVPVVLPSGPVGVHRLTGQLLRHVRRDILQQGGLLPGKPGVGLVHQTNRLNGVGQLHRGPGLRRPRFNPVYIFLWLRGRRRLGAAGGGIRRLPLRLGHLTGHQVAAENTHRKDQSQKQRRRPLLGPGEDVFQTKLYFPR